MCMLHFLLLLLLLHLYLSALVFFIETMVVAQQGRRIGGGEVEECKLVPIQGVPGGMDKTSGECSLC